MLEMEEDPLIQGESSTTFLTSAAVVEKEPEVKGFKQFPLDHQSEQSLSAESTKPAVDPWLPISSEGVSSSSPTKDEGGFNSTSVEQWLNTQVGFDQDQYSNMSPPATTTSGGGGGGGDSSGGSKNQKGRACAHLVKGVSTSGLRKAFKADIKATCSKPSCLISISKPWMCLQCGHIGCGDNGAQGGHAKLHVGTPHSDCHSLAVKLEGNLDKAWCFICQMDIDTNCSVIRDSIQFLRRHSKMKLALTQSSAPVITSAPIVLGPPPPPPMKPEATKIILKGKQNNKMSASTSNSYGRWNRDNSVDWPLGLDNLGNTCFMNSALQCMSRTRSLLDKLDLYGRGNMIEIAVSSEEPCVQMINPIVEVNEVDEAEFSSEFGDKNFLNDKATPMGADSSQPSTSADSSEGGSGEISPSSTEIDSLLDAASSRSSRKSESEGNGDSLEVELWKKELRQELAKPLRLRLVIPRDSMTSKLRNCFRAITRTSDMSPDSEDNVYSRSVYTPRAIQMAVSKHFRLGQQHDSHELLRTVVDMMKKDKIRSFRLAIMQRYGVRRNEGKNCDPKLTELLKMWDRRLYHKTFVDEIFGGELVTFQECLQCRKIKRSHEEFLDLSLPIRVFRANSNHSTKKSYSLFDDEHDYVINRSVEECLRAYTEPEFLTGSNVVECENCHRVNLDRLSAGDLFQEVFPGMNLNPKVEQERNKNKQKKQTKKRPNRQAKIKARFGHDKDLTPSDQQEPPALNLVEDHFTSDQAKPIGRGQNVPGEEDSKSSKSGSLDDYVVVQNASTINKGSAQVKNSRTEVEVYMDYDNPDHCESSSIDTKEIEEALLENPKSNLSRGLSSSIKSLSLIEGGMDVEVSLPPEDEDEHMEHNDQNLDEYMDDLDEPAVDGIGNASDIEDEDSNNGLPILDLGLEVKPISVADYLAVPHASIGAADEGFSEGENSSEEKPSQSLSGSSSHVSISEVDNASDGCENAAKKIPVTKCPCSRRQLISRAPECLTLHLKRFQHTARGSSKLGDNVSFPYILNLTEFCSEVGEDVTKPGFKSSFDEDGEVVYSLYGIVEHSGSLHFGHYVAYVKVAGKQTESAGRADDSWFYISDSHVSRTTLKQVLQNDAYILFYERIRGPEKKERLYHTVQGIEPEEPSLWASQTTTTYTTYDQPATSSATVSTWEEKWEDSSSQQVSSTNDTSEVNMTLTYEADPVSSSTLYSVPLSGVDNVSSTTDADTDSMDYSGPVPVVSASLSHPVWNEEDIQESSSNAYFGEIMEDDNETPNNTNQNVSSSSDVMLGTRSDGYTRLEEVD